MRKALFHILILIAKAFAVVGIALGVLPVGLFFLSCLIEDYLCQWFGMERYKGKYFSQYEGN